MLYSANGGRKAVVPYNAWEPVVPAVISRPGARSAELYNLVIDQFDVEHSGRYTPGKNGATYCNIFVWDVTSAMGAEIPQRVDRITRAPRRVPHTANTVELNANGMIRWLREVGGAYGWRKASAAEAQEAADAGKPAVASTFRPQGIGHLQVIRPSAGNVPPDQISVAQAGDRNYRYGLVSVEGKEFWVHD